MKLEHLTFTAEQLRKLTDEQLRQAFAPFFPETRPSEELKQRNIAKDKARSTSSKMSPAQYAKRNLAMNILAKHGIKL